MVWDTLYQIVKIDEAGSLDLHCLMKRLRSAEPKPFLLNISEIFLQKPVLLFFLEKSLEIAKICSCT